LPTGSDTYTSRARRTETPTANSLSLVRFDRNDYSVPTVYAYHKLTAIGSIDQVRILWADEVIATHPRCWDHHRVTFDPIHYLALLERKPGALDVARPLEDWSLPDCFNVLRRRLETERDGDGTREYIKVLRLLEWATTRQVADAVDYALSIGTVDSDAIQLILEHRRENPRPLFSLDGRPHLAAIQVESPNLGAYHELLVGGAA